MIARAASVTLLAGASLAVAPAASATFPGTNGAIVYTTPEGGPPAPRHIESVYLGSQGTLVPDSANLSATPVDRGGEAFDPAWSADGRSLAFASTRSGDKQIYTVQLDFARRLLAPCAASPCQLTHGAGDSYDPSWSPDGQTLAFTSTDSGSPQIYTMDANGGEVTRLTFDNAVDQQATWSSSGQIAFTSDRAGTAQLYTMNASGGEQRPLTSLSDGVTDPSWSPDGTRIAFASGVPGSYQIYVVAVAGGPPVQLTHFQADNKFPQWSPDGTKLLIAHGPALTAETYVEEIDARTGQRLSGPLARGGDASWAPLPTVAQTPPTNGQQAAPPPPEAANAAVAGTAAVASPLEGKVSVTAGHLEASSSQASSPLHAPVVLPVDSTYNATHGVVSLAFAKSTSPSPSASTLPSTAPGASPPPPASSTAIATAVVNGGMFSVSQNGAKGVPTVRLLGSPGPCAGKDATLARRRGARVRGRTRGSWRGLHDHEGSLGVKGDPEWEIQATCRGTLYRAITGFIVVTDPHRRRPVRVTAGHHYLVRSRRR